MKNMINVITTFILIGSTLAAGDPPHFRTKCVDLNGTISLNITYKTAGDEKKTILMKMNETAVATGPEKCGDATYIKLTEGGRTLTINFTANPKKTELGTDMDPEHWGVTSITYDYVVSEPDAYILGSRRADVDGTFFVTPMNYSYSCSKEAVTLTNVTTRVNGSVVDIHGEKVELDTTGLSIWSSPNKPIKDTSLYNYHYCKADQKVKDIVPIAVGVALAALVVIVLVAYLIGRRRTVSAGGYERV